MAFRSRSLQAAASRRNFLAFTGTALASGVRATKKVAPLERFTVSSPRVEALLRQMTLDELVGQAVQFQVPGGDVTGIPSGLSTSLEDLIRQGRVGSVLNAADARTANKLQRIATEQSRLKIPLFCGYDTVKGFRAIFPTGYARAAAHCDYSWQLVAQTGAEESRAQGIHMLFGPLGDVVRHPGMGRAVEMFGECRHAVSRAVRAEVRGHKLGGVVSCLKHFVAYPKTQPDYGSVHVTEPELREVYYPPFQAGIDEGAGAVMTAYTPVHRQPMSTHGRQIRGVLEGEMNFSGVVITDFGGIRQTCFGGQGTSVDLADAAAKAANAGIVIDMESSAFHLHGAENVKNGRVSLETMREKARRVLMLKEQLGLFENPFVPEPAGEHLSLSTENRERTKQVALKSIVLVKNEPVVSFGKLLPLRPDIKKIGVVGLLAESKEDPIGSWRAQGRAEETVSVLEGLHRKLDPRGVSITYAAGPSVNGSDLIIPKNAEIAARTLGKTEAEVQQAVAEAQAEKARIDAEDQVAIDRAVEAMRGQELILAVVGEKGDCAGENQSRTSIGMSGHQRALLQALHTRLGIPIVGLHMNNAPRTIDWELDHLPCWVQLGHLGTEHGNAAAEVIVGDYNPGGSLPMTVPRHEGSVPDFHDKEPPARPQVYDPEYGFTFGGRYIDRASTCLLPLGWGKSYTTFDIEVLPLAKTRYRRDEMLSVEVKATNVGDRVGDVTPQIYIGPNGARSMTQPRKQRFEFKRLTVEPGEGKEVIHRFEIPVNSLARCNEDNQMVVEAGEYNLWVGLHAEDETRQVTFSVDAPFELGTR